jgi:septum formation protein
MMQSIVLASTSRIRAELLANAGLEFDIVAADIDERAVEAPLIEELFPPDDIAAVLAEAKAMDVAERFAGAYVIGADQVLGFEGRRWTKPASIEEARRNLLDLRGKTHELHSAIACVRDGETLWRHVSTARLTMRDFSPEFLGRYLAAVGDAALQSVGCYQLEGQGVQLFDRIEGDFFAILGLPLLPLLAFLRGAGVIDG